MAQSYDCRDALAKVRICVTEVCVILYVPRLCMEVSLDGLLDVQMKCWLLNYTRKNLLAVVLAR